MRREARQLFGKDEGLRLVGGESARVVGEIAASFTDSSCVLSHALEGAKFLDTSLLRERGSGITGQQSIELLESACILPAPTRIQSALE